MNTKRFWKLPAAAAVLMVSGLAQAATVNYAITPPSLPFADPGYTANGSINATVADTPDCLGGTFTVNASPVAGSGPGGSTPPLTVVTTYIGFPQGNFLFSSAGYGQYQLTTTTTGCSDGTPPAPIVDIVTVTTAAVVTNVSPTSGPVAGGTVVTLTGSGFTDASALTFAGVPAASFTVDSDTQITATTPAGAAGPAAIGITTPISTVESGSFTYLAEPAEVRAVPALGQLGLIMMSLLMAMTALIGRRRKLLG